MDTPAARAAANRCAIAGAGRTSPVSETSPTKAESRGGAAPVAADASAAATARSHAGSSTLTPPERRAEQLGSAEREPRDTVEHRRDQLEAPRVEPRRLPARRTIGGTDERLHLDGERATARLRERGGRARHEFAAHE